MKNEKNNSPKHFSSNDNSNKPSFRQNASYHHECITCRRDDKTLYSENNRGESILQLERYVIIPIEYFEVMAPRILEKIKKYEPYKTWCKEFKDNLQRKKD